MAPPNVMSRRLRSAVLLGDLVWILLSATISYLLRYGLDGGASASRISYSECVFASIVAMVVWALLFVRMRLDGFSDGWEAPRVLSQVVTGVSLLMCVMLSVAFLTRQWYSRLLLSYFGLLLLVGLALIRCAMRAYVASRSRNRAMQRVVVMGNGSVAREIAEKIGRHPELMKKVVGFLYSSSDVPVGPIGAENSQQSRPTSTVGVLELLKNYSVDELVVAHPRVSTSEIQKLLRLSRLAGIKVSLVPEGYELYLSKASFLDVEGLPMLCLEERRPPRFALALKRVADVVIATVLGVLASPIILGAIAGLSLSGIRPFKRELRCGLNGDPFLMWRLNVDRDDAELSGVRLWLTRLSLTELPQLVNVIAGDMSLVGPRPEPPDRVKHYSEWQRQRLNAKPGLTGLAQVHGLREQHASEDKARFDLQYLLHWSPLLDLSLLLQTLWTVAIRIWTPRAQAVQSPQARERVFTEVLDVDRSHAGAD